MTELRFPDTATTIARLLIPLAATNRVGIRFPATLTGALPFVRATRTPAPRDRITDYARINIDVLDDDYDRGEALAERISQYLEPGRLRLGPILIDRVTVDAAPQEVAPWAPGIFRFEARYTCTSRRYTAA